LIIKKFLIRVRHVDDFFLVHICLKRIRNKIELFFVYGVSIMFGLILVSEKCVVKRHETGALFIDY